MPLKVWGDYEIDFDRVLGRGGMGAVYRGRQVSVDRPAAIKILKKDLTENPDFVKRFHREAALLARLVDTHVVQVFGAGEAEGQHFYAMEFVEGEDLSARLRRGCRFTLEEVLQVAFRVGRALSAAWRHRIIHRDIKPSNIIIAKDGTIKVMDFGLAKNPEMDYTQSEVIMGTAKYMSPEQAQGQPCDIRSDLYSLGVVLYELATGVPPFTGETLTSLLYQQVHKEPAPPRKVNPAIPEALESVILKLMAKPPGDRYQTPDELMSAVWGILEEVTPEEKTTLMSEVAAGMRRPATTRTKAESPSPGTNPWALYLSLAAGLAIVGTGGYFIVQTLQTTPPPPPPPVTAARAPDAPPSAVPPAIETPKPEPPPPAVPAAPKWEEPRRLGLEAFTAGRWTAAYTNLEQARDLGAPDLDDRIRQARARDLLDKGDAQADDERALEQYEQARTHVNDLETTRKIRGASFRVWSRRAEKHQGGDWAQAAACWARAAEFADESQSEAAESGRKFCEAYANGVRARVAGEWPRALELFKALAREPRGHADSLEKEIRRAEEAVAAAAEAERDQVRRDFESLLAQARAARDRLAWAEAGAALDRMNEPKYSAMPRARAADLLREVKEALAAPPGMAYVPAGEFQMGDAGPRAREIEGPAFAVTLPAFYVDLRETTVGEYAEFLKALEGGAPVAGGPRDIPAGKSHQPDGWEDQKGNPDGPVTGVDWWDAAAFAAWKKKKLPSEAEWEKSAGFDLQGRRAYPWGQEYRKEGGPNLLGCEGMGGGVIEWTSSWFDKYPGSPASHFDFGQKKRVLRGGILLAEDSARDARVTHRKWYPPTYRSRRIGFRCAKDIRETKEDER